MEGLAPPFLEKRETPATGALCNKLWWQNRALQEQQQKGQNIATYWTTHWGQFFVPTDKQHLTKYKNEMHPKGLALYHPAASLLKEYATFGCPTQTGKMWMKAEIWEAVAQDPHRSSLLPEAIEHFLLESLAKVAAGQAILVQCDGIKDNPPPQLMIFPIATIPHKSKAFRSILDLSFTLCLLDSSKLPSSNDTLIKTVQSGAID
jgi:hypothetical protein